MKNEIDNLYFSQKLKMMKYSLLILFVAISFAASTQEIINLKHEKAENVNWNGNEKDYYSQIWQNRVVTNVSVPTMQVFRPEKGNINGTSVIVAPGGGLYALSMDSEGDKVGEWLASKGITAFVLKYRLVPTGDDGVAEISELGQSNPKKLMEEVAKVIPYSIADGLGAIEYVRENNEVYGIKKDKIGFMGFSAGGAVTMGVMYESEMKNKPDFIVPVYPWTYAVPVIEAPSSAPPMLVICATDDPLKLAAGSIELYNSWLDKGYRVGLHMYSKGGHGFGMKKQGLPSDDWIQRFYDWSVAEGLTSPIE